MTSFRMDPSLKNPDEIRQEISNLVQQYADAVYAPSPFIAGVTTVPVSGKVLGAMELKNMVEASLDGWLTTGRFNALFEKKLAEYLGVKHLITVNSGSSANLVAFSTLTSGHSNHILLCDTSVDILIRDAFAEFIEECITMITREE